MSQTQSLYFYTMHKCASSLFALYGLKNITGLKHKDYATDLFNQDSDAQLAFEDTGYAYGPIRVSANTSTPVYRLLVEPTCRPEFVRDKTALLMIRDPRDILISGYYSAGWSHTISPVAELAEKQRIAREKIQNWSLDDYVLKFAAGTVTHFETIVRLKEACPRSSVLRYEDMIHDWPVFSSTLTKYADFDDAVLTELYTRSRPRDAVNVGEHRRSGQTEQFRTALKPETVTSLGETFGPVLDHFGYDR